VQLKDNGIALGSPQPLVGGSAQVQTSSLTTGAHIITAEYTNADGNFDPSTGH